MGVRASIFFLLHRNFFARSQNCSTDLISSLFSFQPFPSARKGKMVRLIPCSCSVDPAWSLLHPGSEGRERDEGEGKQGESPLFEPSLSLSCSRARPLF